MAGCFTMQTPVIPLIGVCTQPDNCLVTGMREAHFVIFETYNLEKLS